MKITERRLRSVIKNVIRESMSTPVLTLDAAQEAANNYINGAGLTDDDYEYGYISEIIVQYNHNGDISSWFVKYNLYNNRNFNFQIKTDGTIAPMQDGAL